ncbi:MAG: hypothetical protein KAS74_04280 [Methanosarcinales archaeon]|nr:hypothetical protein [Methanosarcinales archaeon]
MSELLYTYILAKTLYERNKDYVDSFWPFLLKVLPRDEKALGFNSIQRDLKKSFGLDVPKHSLNTLIIDRAKKGGYVKQTEDGFRLTDSGIKYLEQLESESEINRKVNELLEDIKNQFGNMQILSTEDIYKILLQFINENLRSVIEFFQPTEEVSLYISKKKLREYEDEIVQYFKIAEERKPGLYDTLRDIVYGSIISTVFASTIDISEVNKRFKNVELFLDSNFMFSILGLGDSKFSEPAKELFNLLKQYEFEVKVFDFTIDEMVGVLKNYQKEQHIYLRTIRVNSIYSNFKRMGYTAEDIREFIQKIEDEIWKLGIEIEPTGLDYRKYEAEREYVSAISTYKPMQNGNGRKHDLAAIEQIKKIRGAIKREIERSKAIFLTSDLKLAKFNHQEMGHKDNATVCEVISDRLLTNILWLKNPTLVKDIPLKSIISNHSRNLFIERGIWIQFWENIRKLQKCGDISDRDISMLFYGHHIEDVLYELNESDADIITPEFILEKKDEVIIEIEVQKQKELEQQRTLFEEQLSQKELEKEEKFGRKLGEIKRGIKSSAEKQAKWIPRLFTGVIAVILLSISPRIVEKWDYIEPYAWVISIIVALLVGGVTWWEMKKRFETRVFNWIYKRKLREMKLDSDV